MTEKEYHKRVRSYLDRIGATHIDLDGSRRHGRLSFHYQGRDLKMVVPKTPSEYRSDRNAVAFIKRMIRSPNDS